MSHTPTPWRSSFPSYVIGGGIKICQLKGIYINNPNREADAEFIVRACNSHDELLEACEKLVAWDNGHGNDELYTDACEIAKRAIAKTQSND